MSPTDSSTKPAATTAPTALTRPAAATLEAHAVQPGTWRASIADAVKANALRFVTLFVDDATPQMTRVCLLLAQRAQPRLHLFETRLAHGQALQSITALLPGANWLEREAMELWGVPLEGHPDPRPVLQHRGWPAAGSPMRGDFFGGREVERLTQDPDYGFTQVEGEGVCEVPVGPIHAGIIEPGHFRFSIAGEPVLHLEIRLGYQHKGIEKLMVGRTPDQGLVLAERTSGDNSVAHATAYCQAVEAALAIPISARAQDLRTLFLEVERVTQHLGDIGGVLMDVAFNFGASQFAILREEMFRLNADVTGSRLLFGVNRVGGVRVEPTQAQLRAALDTLKRIGDEAKDALRISLSSSSVVDRLDGTGILPRDAALLLGVVGPTARASGIHVDARHDVPHAAYHRYPVRVHTEEAGDVLARIRVKVAELEDSIRLICTIIEDLSPEAAPRDPPSPLTHDGFGFGFAEAHRGEVTYAVRLGADGCLQRCHIRDPSTLNWRALEVAVPGGNIIADFPVINKSFNLSYSGNDR